MKVLPTLIVDPALDETRLLELKVLDYRLGTHAKIVGNFGHITGFSGEQSKDPSAVSFPSKSSNAAESIERAYGVGAEKGVCSSEVDRSEHTTCRRIRGRDPVLVSAGLVRRTGIVGWARVGTGGGRTRAIARPIGRVVVVALGDGGVEVDLSRCGVLVLRWWCPVSVPVENRVVLTGYRPVSVLVESRVVLTGYRPVPVLVESRWTTVELFEAGDSARLGRNRRAERSDAFDRRSSRRSRSTPVSFARGMVRSSERSRATIPIASFADRARYSPVETFSSTSSSSSRSASSASSCVSRAAVRSSTSAARLSSSAFSYFVSNSPDSTELSASAALDCMNDETVRFPPD